jgi:hypothetical protein
VPVQMASRILRIVLLYVEVDTKIIYRRYASLFFICSISPSDNELLTLEIVHRYVEVLDRYFGNVCELDLIFNFQKAYAVSIADFPRSMNGELMLTVHLFG